MKAAAGALLVLAGAVLTGLGVLAEAVYQINPRPNAAVPVAVTFAQLVGIVVAVVGGVMLTTGFPKPDEPAGPRVDGMP